MDARGLVMRAENGEYEGEIQAGGNESSEEDSPTGGKFPRN